MIAACKPCPTGLSRPHLQELCAAATDSGYSRIVIDGPSLSDGADALALEGACDGVLLVARALSTKAAALRRAADDLGPIAIGAVLVGA